MNEIIKISEVRPAGALVITEQIKGKLSPSEFQIASIVEKTNDNKRVCEMLPFDTLKLAAIIVSKAEIRLGSAYKDKVQQKVWVTEIDSDFKKFPNLTGLELLKATELGLDGEFTDNGVVIFSPSNWVMWVKAFIAKVKIPVMQKLARLNQDQESKVVEPTLEESLESKCKILEIAIQNTLAGAIYQDYGNVLYDFLEKFEYLLLTSDQKWKAMDMAKLVMLSEAQETKDRSKIKSVMNIIDDFGKGIKSDAVTAVAKRWIVSEKLKDITSTGSDDAADFIDNVRAKIADYLEEYSADTLDKN